MLYNVFTIAMGTQLCMQTKLSLKNQTTLNLKF